jgi:hypothetical protein
MDSGVTLAQLLTEKRPGLHLMTRPHESSKSDSHRFLDPGIQVLHAAGARQTVV